METCIEADDAARASQLQQLINQIIHVAGKHHWTHLHSKSSIAIMGAESPSNSLHLSLSHNVAIGMDGYTDALQRAYVQLPRNALPIAGAHRLSAASVGRWRCQQTHAARVQ